MTERRTHRDAPWSGERCAMRERVSAYVDQETSEVETAAVRRHLAACTTCREFVAFSRGTQAVVRRSRPPRAARAGAGVLPAQLSAAARGRGKPPYTRSLRSALGLAAVLLLGVLTGAIGVEVAINESETATLSGTVTGTVAVTVPTPTAVTLYQPKISPGTPLDPDFVRYFETAPKPALVYPVVWVIDPLPPDPSFRWAGIEPGQAYPEGYRLEVVMY